MHLAHRALPDRLEQERLSLYVSNITQSSFTSHEKARQALEARRTEDAEGSARSEVAKHGRRQLTRRKMSKRRRIDVEAELNTANLLEKDGRETFSKFRSCCNAASNIRDSSGEFMIYKGFEDRWLNDREYRARQTENEYLPDRNVALHRDSQAALYSQDDFMRPHNPDATIVELLIKAREWIKWKAHNHQEEQLAMSRARLTAEK